MTAIKNNEQLSPIAAPLFSRVFSVFLAAYPVLCIYKAFSRFTIGDVLLMAFFLLCILKMPKIHADLRLGSAILFVLYAGITLLFNVLFTPATAAQGFVSLFWRIAKFGFYISCAFLCGRPFLDLRLFKKSVFAISACSCVFIGFQYVAYFLFDKIVLGHIPFLTLYLQDYADLNYEAIFSMQFRPSAIFLEPAHFAQYTIVALVFLLYDKSVFSKKTKVLGVMLIIVGIALSTSGQGFLYLFSVLLIFPLRQFKNKFNAFLFLFGTLFLAFFSYRYISVIQSAVDRLINNESAASARLGSYSYCVNLKGLSAIFGNGYGAVPKDDFMSGAAYVWYGCGIVGLILAVALFFAFYRKAQNPACKMVCFVFFIMFFGTSLFYSYMVFWFFSIIMATEVLQDPQKDAFQKPKHGLTVS